MPVPVTENAELPKVPVLQRRITPSLSLETALAKLLAPPMQFLRIAPFKIFVFPFTELKNPEEIYNKHQNDEHHDEFDLTGISKSHIEDMVKNKYIPYDHSADKTDFFKKWNKNNRIFLTKISDDKLPKFLIDNKSKYFKWFD